MMQKYMSDERFHEIKKAYDSYPVPDEALGRIREGIEQAKREGNGSRGSEEYRTKKGSIRQFCQAAGMIMAAAIAVIIIFANSSASVAMAMEKIPIIGAITKVVIFRDYKYESERHNADIEIPEIVVDTEDNETEEVPEDVQQNLQKSSEEINAEIQKIAEGFLREFEENLKYEEGYQDVVVKSEIMNTTQDYFTLKLICYMASGSGAEWNYYYTIDFNTGERLQLKDLFREGTDYITPISENIKEQMRRQMEEDEMKRYWLDDEIEEWNFRQITDETAFYLNENGNIVISFDEGDVAPMYMGVVTFEIPKNVVEKILK